MVSLMERHRHTETQFHKGNRDGKKTSCQEDIREEARQKSWLKSCVPKNLAEEESHQKAYYQGITKACNHLAHCSSQIS